jgi:hypothetical protein
MIFKPVELMRAKVLSFGENLREALFGLECIADGSAQIGINHFFSQ